MHRLQSRFSSARHLRRVARSTPVRAARLASERFVNLDHALLHLVNAEWTCNALDRWSAAVTASETWLVPGLVVVALVAWRGCARTRSALVVGLLTLGLVDVALVEPCKVLVARARPREELAGLRSTHLVHVEPRLLALGAPLEVTSSAPSMPPVAPRSFPSGHAWDAFALATLLTRARRRWAFVAFPVAAMVAYARVYSGAHWPSDVLASALFAPVVTLVVAHAIERVMPRALKALGARHAAWTPWRGVPAPAQSPLRTPQPSSASTT
jgi:membrane-associated phospholipid phosphatase